MRRAIIGGFNGTGAAINVTVGFKPDGVLLWNLSGDAAAAWLNLDFDQSAVTGGGSGTDDMDEGDVFTMTAAAFGLQGSNGISLYSGGDQADGTETYKLVSGASVASGTYTGEGFTVGTNADCNTDAEAVMYLAFQL